MYSFYVCVQLFFNRDLSYSQPGILGCAAKRACMPTMLCSSYMFWKSLVIKEFIPELFKVMPVPGCVHTVCVCSPPIPSLTHTKPLLPSWQRNGSVTDIRPASLIYVFLSVTILSVKGENMPFKSLTYGATAA